MHPPIQPHDSGWLEVGDGHAVYWEQCGHPGAPAALFVHGGPGAGASVQDRRWCHPQHWRTVLFDQRGCARSRAEDGLRANTTAHLVQDMEALRQHLGLNRWLLVGSSWGTCLALAYARAHPQRVSGLVLRGVFLATAAERGWLYSPGGAARSHPQAWRRLRTAVGLQESTDLLDALFARLQSDDAGAMPAAQAWWRWEQDLMAAESAAPCEAVDSNRAHSRPPTQHSSPQSKPPPPPPPHDDDLVLRAARIGVHYARANWFSDEHDLLQAQHLQVLQHLPCVILQGRQDQVTPPAAARALHAAWPGSQLRELAHAGHASTHPEMAQAFVDAIESMTELITPQHRTQESSHGLIPQRR